MNEEEISELILKKLLMDTFDGLRKLKIQLDHETMKIKQIIEKLKK